MSDINGFEWEATSANEIEANVSTRDSSNLVETFNTLILEGDFQSLKIFLQEKAVKGRNVPIINNCISQLLKSKNYYFINFWAFVRVLVMHNASLFLATISKSISRDIIPPCDPATLDDIVKNAFMAKDKLHHAINLVSIVSKQLSFEQKEYILNSCLKTNNPDTLAQSFKMLDMPPSFVISFLRNKIDNSMVLFTLFDYYRIASLNNELSNNTIIEVYSIPYINILINELKNSDGQQCRDVAYLIEYVIGIVSKCENVRLYKLVSKLGYKGFLNYYENIKGKKFREEAIKNIIFKDKSYTFKMIGKLPNYYILLNTTTNLRALLPIELSDNVNEAQIHAYVYKYDKKNNVLYANQIQIPSDYAEPCILKIGSEVIISFSLRNGNLYPQLRRLTSLIKVKVCNINMVEDYKLKYIAIVRKKITDFKYMVEIIDLL